MNVFEAVSVGDRDVVAVRAQLDGVVLAKDLGGVGEVNEEFVLDVAGIVLEGYLVVGQCCVRVAEKKEFYHSVVKILVEIAEVVYTGSIPVIRSTLESPLQEKEACKADFQ